ncbi:tRNA pseudouridine synthase B [Polystyrenella longa]|uniref:tRNA pseudouridine synthase B n=1 Tax=Polystyrenella longa TaxID=2528007 RepID=A0A518CPT5_9PLAN|nr:tRNA pseudouridine(55) synthase TruB [Polystyrenella longa]QDU81233.1 tRNA pseudouridine synthase B [Polystyrenella longa]
MSVIAFKKICGVLTVNKPVEMTSRQAVTEVEWHTRRLAREHGQKIRRATVKVGHAGTLDPLATGVLVVCVGKATQLVPWIQELPKTYRAEFTLGMRSNSDDIMGEVETVDNPPQPSRSEIEAALSRYQGTIEQVPPQFSAVHVDGKRAYALARRGEEVKLDARPVEIYDIEILDYNWPELTLNVVCGSGTYIRAIARDLGNDLGCGALMHGLARTAVGPFTLEDAIEIPHIKEQNWLPDLQPARVAVKHLPTYECSPSEEDWLINGRIIEAVGTGAWREGDIEIPVANSDGRLVCIATKKQKTGEQLQLKPRLVFKPTLYADSLEKTTPLPESQSSL